MPANQTGGFSAEICKQIRVISKSQWYMIVTICAIFLSYYSVDIMKKQLVCSATDSKLCKCLPKALPFQTLSSVMVLVALFFYVQVSGDSLCQAKRQGNAKQVHDASLGHLSNLLVLIAGMIRFGLLTAQNDVTPAL